ncbi:hypothetical protein AX14_011222 [Amanita brunnescens Koide BX004]|nr:hypothetical protein AX14_011222 [Amanita brunnescens Koide BX004]
MAVDEERGEHCEHVRLLLSQRWGVNGVGGGAINGNGLVANEESVGYCDDDNDSGGGEYRQWPKQVSVFDIFSGLSRRSHGSCFDTGQYNFSNFGIRASSWALREGSEVVEVIPCIGTHVTLTYDLSEAGNS